MKEYKDYMDNITVTADLHEKILQRTKQKPVVQMKTRIPMRYVVPAALAAACVIVLGITLFTQPQLFRIPGGKTHDGPGSSMIFNPSENLDKDDDTLDENLRTTDYELTLEQACADIDFGAYISLNVPPRFRFESSQRSTDRDSESLSVLWKEAADNNDGSITWKITRSAADEFERIVRVQEREKYDMTLYSFPWDKSVPSEFLRYFNNPVFLSDELTLDALWARAYHADSDSRESTGLQMDFSVLYGDVIVLISTKGASPEQIYEMLTVLKDAQTSYGEQNNTGNWKSADGN